MSLIQNRGRASCEGSVHRGFDRVMAPKSLPGENKSSSEQGNVDGVACRSARIVTCRGDCQSPPSGTHKIETRCRIGQVSSIHHRILSNSRLCRRTNISRSDSLVESDKDDQFVFGSIGLIFSRSGCGEAQGNPQRYTKMTECSTLWSVEKQEKGMVCSAELVDVGVSVMWDQ